MSLNAAVTPEGGEIGRAQAMAAGIAPHVDMNPILLKPEGHSRSQVVLLGEVYGTRTARDYEQEKLRLFPIVCQALERLRATYDVVVIEGAGSPAEINLNAHEIVNMGVAHAADAPVDRLTDHLEHTIWMRVCGGCWELRVKLGAHIANSHNVQMHL